MTELLPISWSYFIKLLDRTAENIKDHYKGDLNEVYFWGIPVSGTIIASIMVKRHGGNLANGLRDFTIVDKRNICVVDDLCDTGKTLEPYVLAGSAGIPITTATLYRRYSSTVIPSIVGQVVNHDNWIVWPWESKSEEQQRADAHRIN